MIQTREEAEASRKQLMKDARDEVEGTRTRWLEALDREKNSFLQELRRRAGEQILDIVRRVLADLADTGLEQQVIEGFSKRLTEMDQEKRETVIASLKTDRNVVITSAFELPDSARNEIASVLESNLEDGLQLTFRTSPEVVTGIEVKLPGYKMAWSVDDYLESLEANLREALEEKASL
jgi:F-type H+-transporting ATPase subunit b